MILTIKNLFEKLLAMQMVINLFRIKNISFNKCKKVSIIYSLLLFWTVIIALAPKTQASMETDSIYGDMEYFSIYQQKTVLEKIADEVKIGLTTFKDRSAEEQQEFLANFRSIQDQLTEEFKKRRESLIDKRLNKNNTRLIGSLILPLGLQIYNMFTSTNPSTNIGPFTMALSMMSLQSFNQILTKNLEIRDQKSLSSMGPIGEYELAYVRIKPFLDEKFTTVIEHKLLAARKNSFYMESYQDWLEAAINLPLSKKPIDPQIFETKFKEEVTNIPQALIEPIKRLCVWHIAQPSGRRVPYFQGPPGVGKTSCARTIARILQVPFGSLTLAKCTLAELVGQGGQFQAQPGKIAETLLNAKDEKSKTYTNMVLLIDEADRILNSENEGNGLLPFFLDILEGKTESYYNPYFQTHIRMKDMLIILAGNSEIKDSALKNRLVCCSFPPASLEQKENYAFKTVIPRLRASKRKAPYALEWEKDFSEHDRESIRQLVEKDQDSGFRSIDQAVNQYFANKLVNKFCKKET